MEKKKARPGTKVLAIILSLVIAFGLLPVMAIETQASVVDSGECGDNLTWTLSDSGTLTISGTGAMYDYRTAWSTSAYYGTYDKTPWDTTAYANYEYAITKVVIESGVTTIGEYAFSLIGDTLTSISIADSVVSIGCSAFLNCVNLTSVTIPSNVVSIGDSAFYGCSGLLSITIPDTVAKIEPYTFYECSGLKTVVLSEGISSIEYDAFNGCSSLTQIEIPESVTEIGEYAFYKCTGLSGVTFSEGLVSIDSNAFEGCTSLTSIEISDSTAWIGACAFRNCSSLVTATLSGGVEYVGENAFEYCTALTTVVIGSGLNTIQSGTFAYCTKLSSITIPFSVLNINDEAFGYCIKLTDVYYTGTALGWKSINFGDENAYLINADIHYVDSWNFYNTEDADAGFTDTYYITSADKSTLYENLSYVEKRKIEIATALDVDGQSLLTSSWKGSCHGMSAWVFLNLLGELSASDISASASELSELSSSLTVQSAINFYQVQQALSPSVQAETAFMSLDQETQLDYIVSQIEAGLPVFISFQWYEADGDGLKYNGLIAEKASHAIVGYAIEDGDYTEYVENYLGDRTQGVKFTHRILIYDPSYYWSGMESGYIYYSDDGTWCIPGRYIISTSSESAEKNVNNNGVLKLATSDESDINVVDYITGTYTNSNTTSEDFLNCLTTTSDGSSISWGSYAAVIDGFSVLSNTGDEDIYAIVNSGVELNGSEGESVTVVLPDSDSYTVESDDEIELMLESGNYLTVVESDRSGSVTLLSDGGAEVETEDEATITVSVTANDGYTELPWNTIEVTAEAAAEILVELTSEGLVLSGDNLSDVTITAESNDDSVETALSTEDDTVLISSDANDGVQITEGYEIPEDTSGDGSNEEEGSDDTATGGSTSDDSLLSIESAEITLAETEYTYDGTEKRPGITVTLEDTVLTEGTDYTVEYSNNTDAGTASVTVTGIGSYTGSVTAEYTINAKSISGATVTLSSTSYTYNGTARKPGVKSVVLNGTTLSSSDYTISYASGRKNVGTYKVEVTGTGNYTGTVAATFKIKAKSINGATVTLSSTSYTYNGTARKPGVKSVVLSGTTLSSSDYTISYASGRKNVGTYKVKVTGTGNYTGTATATFKIKAKSISSATVKLKTTSYTYNGKARKPTVSSVRLTLNGSAKTLTKNTDYTVSYKSNTKAGTATVTITGKGNYTGTAKTTFTIKKASQTLKVTKATKTVKYSKVRNAKQTVKAIVKVSGAKGTVTYSKVSSGSSKYLSVSKTTGKITVKKGTPKGTYKIKVKITSGSTTNYKSASKTVTITIKVK